MLCAKGINIRMMEYSQVHKVHVVAVVVAAEGTGYGGCTRRGVKLYKHVHKSVLSCLLGLLRKLQVPRSNL